MCVRCQEEKKEESILNAKYSNSGKNESNYLVEIYF